MKTWLRKAKVLGLRRARIWNRWLKLRVEKPWTFFLAGFFPFLQAFLGSVLVIYTNPAKNETWDNVSLYLAASLYYFSFAMNSKRASKGSWIGLVLLIMFGALGIVSGKMFMIWID